MLDKRKFFINGKWVNPNNKNDFDVINPSNEESYAVISLGNKNDVDIAVNAAKKAFATWSEVDIKEKILLLEKLLKIYKYKWNDLTETMSNEMGAPLDWSSSAQTSSGYDHIKDFIVRLKQFEFEKKFQDNSNNFIVYEPIGVCGLITPWNANKPDYFKSNRPLQLDVQ